MQDYERFLIKEYKHWKLYLHENQYFIGRVYLWAKREDALDLMSATDEELKELVATGREVKQALSELFGPDLFNYAALANIAPHLHMHIIPRYKEKREFNGEIFTDQRWGKNYAPYDYDFKVSEEMLMSIKDELKKKL